jgi:large subunit ribosomal protein L16
MYRARVKRGRILFEVNGLNKEIASKAFKLATYKLPLRTRLVEK